MDGKGAELKGAESKRSGIQSHNEDPVLSMNNLKDMPFTDFMVLHGIFPKIFMLEIDSKKTMQRMNS